MPVVSPSSLPPVVVLVLVVLSPAVVVSPASVAPLVLVGIGAPDESLALASLSTGPLMLAVAVASSPVVLALAESGIVAAMRHGMGLDVSPLSSPQAAASPESASAMKR